MHWLFGASNVRIFHKHVCCAADGLVAAQDNNKGSPCNQDVDSQGVEIQIPSLPEVKP